MKKNNILIISVFLASIILPLVYSDKAGNKISASENRYLAPFPTILAPDLKLAPGITSGLENWINDNVGFRAQIKKLQTDIDFYAFHLSPTTSVHIGPDGWLFYTLENNLEIAKGTYPLSQDQLEVIKENQVNVQQALKKIGIEYVIVLAPSKASVYPEHIGGGLIARETVINIVSDFLRENTTIPIINTKPDLLQAKKNELVYFKTDTHWNDAGAYVGYCSIINVLNKLGMINSSPIVISTTPSAYKGDLATIMGIDLFPPEPFLATQIVSPNANKIESGYYFNSLQAVMKLDNVTTFSSYDNPKAEKKRLLIYGDSFFAKRHIKELLAENFSNVDFVLSYDIRNNVIELAKPDIVMFEVTERYISTLMTKPNPALISNKYKSTN